jgi:hypothetical protein
MDTDQETGEETVSERAWKDWIIVLRVQAQDRYPPTQWAWGTVPCSADATDAQLLAALRDEGGNINMGTIKEALAKPSTLPK